MSEQVVKLVTYSISVDDSPVVRVYTQDDSVKITFNEERFGSYADFTINQFTKLYKTLQDLEVIPVD